VTTQTHRRARHSVSLLHTHLVFVTKHRPPVFTDAMLTFCEHTMHTACTELDVELVEFNGETDHVHLLVAYPPALAVSLLVQRLKGRTANPVRREYTDTGARTRGHLWSPSYFAVSCGGAPLSIIKQHIDGQARPHRAPGHARRQTRWANPGLKSEACVQEDSGHADAALTAAVCLENCNAGSSTLPCRISLRSSR
jgi:putative transposase